MIKKIVDTYLRIHMNKAKTYIPPLNMNSAYHTSVLQMTAFISLPLSARNPARLDSSLRHELIDSCGDTEIYSILIS